MDIFSHLTEEHETARRLFGELREKGRDEQLLEELKEELRAHMNAEERVLYTRLEKEDEVQPMIQEAYEEHQAAARLLGDLPRARNEHAWQVRLSELAEAVERHVREEEDELFPKARMLLGEAEPEDLLARYEKVEEELKASS